MVRKLVECIPNFSEGRRLEVIAAIVEVIQSVPNVLVLDHSSDPDHNRSVITFVSSPEGVSEAAFRSIQKAAELINMKNHQGEHPRIGATDVVPFVPISAVTMDECVALARELGRRVGETLNIPVYLYEAAAMRPARQRLEYIRRGGYEILKQAIANDPERKPDFGPTRMGSAGATAIGARTPLIAFNVYLTTDNVNVARAIARKIRESSGGFPHVKAIGRLVGGRAQVSINFTDCTRASIAEVLEAIRLEAGQLSLDVHHTELVGLMPLGALVDVARRYLQLDSFSSEQVLETRLYSVLDAE
jgi:glutamate formiminotransferase